MNTFHKSSRTIVDPPPPPPGIEEDTNNKKKIWILIGAALLGLLIAILLVFLFRKLQSSGSGAGTGQGGDEVIITSLSAENSGTDSKTDEIANPSKKGEADVSSIGTGNNSPDSPTESLPSSVPGSSAPSSKDSSTSPEVALYVYDATTPQAQAPDSESSTKNGGGSSSSGKGEQTIDSKGRNPFLGDGPPSKSIVFVIDISPSMQEEDKLGRVMRWLNEAIDRLTADQKVKVILFDFGAYPDNVAKGLYPATPNNKKKLKAWLNQTFNSSGTDPTLAMQKAIDLRPERIDLLTDGDFDPYCVDVVTKMNQKMKKPSTINCIGLLEDIPNLRLIAKQNKGMYWQVRK